MRRVTTVLSPSRWRTKQRPPINTKPRQIWRGFLFGAGFMSSVCASKYRMAYGFLLWVYRTNLLYRLGRLDNALAHHGRDKCDGKGAFSKEPNQYKLLPGGWAFLAIQGAFSSRTYMPVLHALCVDLATLKMALGLASQIGLLTKRIHHQSHPPKAKIRRQTGSLNLPPTNTSRALDPGYPATFSFA